jgi:DNA-binding SARP family transcriptional activator
MALQVRLLGRPSAELDGAPVRGPRGRKSWALLAVLLLAERPLSRRSLADLLFPDAGDPLGALRWTLSQLRGGLAGYVHADGDPVLVRLDPECRVDAVDLLGGQPDREWDRPGPPETLLDGADGAAGPDFDLWLTAARHRISTAQGARLRGAAQRALSAAKPATAVAAAAHAVMAEPADPATRATLVGSLVAAGDHAAALAQLREWSMWIRKELRISELMSGAGDRTDAGQPRSDTDALCRIEAGRAAMAAGAVAVGLEHLREAVRLAGRRSDDRLQATGLVALGGALVHALAAHACEGTSALRAAALLARRAGDGSLAAEALRDLAFVENTRGRVGPTRRLLSAAAAAAGDDRSALSAVRAIEGMSLADRGMHGRALAALRRSAELAESSGRLRQAAWSISIASRSLLLRGELESATEHAELCLQMAAEERWTAMLPWMEAILAELDLAAGRVAQAERRLRHAWSLSQVLGDWCWQGMTARGLGMVAYARDDIPEATRWLDEAARRARQDHDRYVWIHAWVQEARCQVSVAGGLPHAEADVARLGRLAAATCQPDFAARADLHRAALGNRQARDRVPAVAGARRR